MGASERVARRDGVKDEELRGMVGPLRTKRSEGGPDLMSQILFLCRGADRSHLTTV